MDTILFAQNEPFIDPITMVTISLIAVALYVMILLPDRKKRKAHDNSLAELKKNDRVVTIGGIFGSVTNVQKGSDEVTIKVDETTGAKLRVRRSAINQIITSDEKTKNE